ncbi:hypothetical protein BGZ99_009519 [Dissophora globulifera]|uniref:LysM domain-containing protein n=1 Tax=Dissophora globulifera TaxID=979702 RepID=A0A9P6R8Q6_9FUNG|nr:hypothetical protein BGZ99_009519 [Dissophora globulifera]
MKFTLSVAILALAASQAMAVVPIPVKECTKTVVVKPTDTGCADFATANGCTFDDLLKWNTKLSPKCTNLDVGAPLCVSVTPGAGGAPAGGAPAGGHTTTAAGSHPAATTVVGTKPTSAASKPPTSTPVVPKTGSVVSNTNSATSAMNAKSSVTFAAIGVLASVVYML